MKQRIDHSQSRSDAPVSRRACSHLRVVDPVSESLATVASGDVSAFEDLYLGIAPMVNAIAMRVTRNAAVAEEVTQEVLTELWCSAHRFDASRGSARAWIAAIAHGRSVDRVRSEASSRRRELAELVPPVVQSDNATERLEAIEECRQLEAALRSLTDSQRQAITLAFYDGYTYREVAARLGVPEGTVKTRIRDGLGRLRHNLAS